MMDWDGSGPRWKVQSIIHIDLSMITIVWLFSTLIVLLNGRIIVEKMDGEMDEKMDEMNGWSQYLFYDNPIVCKEFFRMS